MPCRTAASISGRISTVSTGPRPTRLRRHRSWTYLRLRRSHARGREYLPLFGPVAAIACMVTVRVDGPSFLNSVHDQTHSLPRSRSGAHVFIAGGGAGGGQSGHSLLQGTFWERVGVASRCHSGTRRLRAAGQGRFGQSDQDVARAGEIQDPPSEVFGTATG